jgi:hypothetical protein
MSAGRRNGNEANGNEAPFSPGSPEARIRQLFDAGRTELEILARDRMPSDPELLWTLLRTSAGSSLDPDLDPVLDPALEARLADAFQAADRASTKLEKARPLLDSAVEALLERSAAQRAALQDRTPQFKRRPILRRVAWASGMAAAVLLGVLWILDRSDRPQLPLFVLVDSQAPLTDGDGRLVQLFAAGELSLGRSRGADRSGEGTDSPSEGNQAPGKGGD